MLRRFIGLILLLTISVVLVGCGEKEKTIKVYTRDTTSGTRDGFFSTIGFSEAVTDNTVLADGYVEVDSNGGMITAVKNDEFAIGYISLTSLETANVKGLSFNGVKPTEANVLNGTYALTRNFNYIVGNDFTNQTEAEIVEAFLAFLTTSDAKSTIISEGGITEINNEDPSWNDIKADYPISNKDNSEITIKFGGSTSVEKIAKALSAEFSAKCGNFIFEHNHTGSGDAYKRTQGSEKSGTNALHIAFASRDFKDSEEATLGTSGKICIDAIVAVVNKTNDLDNITEVTMKKIYDGTITKWGEIE